MIETHLQATDHREVDALREEVARLRAMLADGGRDGDGNGGGDRDGADGGGGADGDGRPGGDARRGNQEARFRTLVEGMPQLVWSAVGRGSWTWASPQWIAYTGLSDSASRDEGWLRAVHPDDRDIARTAWARAAADEALDMAVRLFHAPEQRYRHFRIRASAVPDPEGGVSEWLGTCTDVDDIQRLQQQQQFLLGELQLRVRNMLTVVRSVFSRTVDAGGEVEDMIDHFRGRLDALARTQVIVTQTSSGEFDLENLIRDELLGVGPTGDRVSIAGPTVSLPASWAATIGLVLHELTTNALKFGALATSEATLDIRWGIHIDNGGRPRLDLYWIEQGVPALAVRPTRKGFGRELIEEALPYRLGAETRLEFKGGGVRCTLSVPLPDAEHPAAGAWKDD